VKSLPEWPIEQPDRFLLMEDGIHDRNHFFDFVQNMLKFRVRHIIAKKR